MTLTHACSLSGDGILWLCQEKGKTFSVHNCHGQQSQRLFQQHCIPLHKAIIPRARGNPGTLKSVLVGSDQVRSSTGKCIICLVTASLTKGRGFRLAMFPQLHTDLPLQKAKQLQERTVLPSMSTFNVFFPVFLHPIKRKKKEFIYPSSPLK